MLRLIPSNGVMIGCVCYSHMTALPALEGNTTTRIILIKIGRMET